MSQYPTPPYPPPPGAYPPGGFPPPPPYGLSQPMPNRGNGMAVTAMIMGILLCIPFLTGLLAVIFGLIGLGKAKSRGGAGRGMAIAGLILGILGLAIWSGGVVIYRNFVIERKTQINTFVTALSTNNIAGAKAECHSTMSQATLQRDALAMQTWGPLKDIAISGMHASSTGSGSAIVLNGNAEFAKTTKSLDFTFAAEGGAWKIVEYKLR